MRRPFSLLRSGIVLVALVTTGAATAAAPVVSDAAPELNLRVSYTSRVIGHDGVQRDNAYADLMYRRAGRVWIERDLPRALREAESHGHHDAPGPQAGHAHEAAEGAPLYLRREAGSGKVLVQIALREQKRVIDVDLAHYGNVGYGGSWAAAYWLVDPAALSRMETVGAPREGVQRYRLKQGQRSTLVDWDIAGQYARRIEQSDAHGLSHQLMTVSTLPAPRQVPWATLEGYASGDYSDLLD
ncbi:hypothetical protein [Niveibacterium sp. SC-1]|uniref:hypothetical protein n=1 Tax=Niveibacterium sp. SC-1 TaxID=3135646 RepID=UPI00311D40DE